MKQIATTLVIALLAFSIGLIVGRDSFPKYLTPAEALDRCLNWGGVYVLANEGAGPGHCYKENRETDWLF